ncbi:porin [Aureliella helgolandensis]|uniref:Porin n=1 Tax=Aureliella helgolandensis TaxID=2527968 RepID=A0A518GFN0_9BACT|nr:porin [Aureliella helgolandensis]QDV27399.1 hypothetical protein Q31a_57880 [Aureliella helgolandensis]
MKITKLALSAAIAATCLGGAAFAASPAQQPASDYEYYAAQPAPVTTAAAVRSQYAAVIPASSSCGDAPVSCCDTSGINACDSMGGFLGGGCDSASGCSDEPWKLFQNDVLGFTIGGWSQVGYHTYNNSLFNNRANNVELQQAWMYAERVADGSNGLGFGGRIDYIYGTDGPNTQSFGPGNGHWDNTWDNGVGDAGYGHAIPQLYVEAAYGDLSVKVGHFFTLIGYEVVGATGNFFYSHSYTMNNSEPFTHTGALAQYQASDKLTLYGGYVLGWDSAFEDNGDAFLGGSSYDYSDNVNITGQFMFGRFANDEVGYMSSTVISSQLTDNWQHVLWIDLLDTDGTGRSTERETFDVNNYLLYTINDQVTWGQRLEWYNVDKGIYGVNAGRSDIYAYTTGINYAPTSNLMFRPEIRWDWDKDNVAGNELGSSQTTFGTDMIFTF